MVDYDGRGSAYPGPGVFLASGGSDLGLTGDSPTPVARRSAMRVDKVVVRI